MIEAVTPVVSPGPGAGQKDGAQVELPGAADAEAAGPPPPVPEPLSIDIARGADGVFVYTLSDPGTGAILAVIPRQDVQLGRDGRNLDQRV